MILEPTVSYGAIITGGTTLLGFLGMYALFQVKQDKQVAMLAMKVDTLTEVVDGVKNVLLVQAQQTVRLDQHEKLIDELRHGEGLVIPLGGKNKTAFGNG